MDLGNVYEAKNLFIATVCLWFLTTLLLVDIIDTGFSLVDFDETCIEHIGLTGAMILYCTQLPGDRGWIYSDILFNISLPALGHLLL